MLIEIFLYCVSVAVLQTAPDQLINSWSSSGILERFESSNIQTFERSYVYSKSLDSVYKSTTYECMFVCPSLSLISVCLSPWCPAHDQTSLGFSLRKSWNEWTFYQRAHQKHNSWIGASGYNMFLDCWYWKIWWFTWYKSLGNPCRNPRDVLWVIQWGALCRICSYFTCLRTWKLRQ